MAKDSLFDGLDEALNALVPLSRTMREEIDSLRQWAKTRARLANTPDDEPDEQRKIRPVHKQDTVCEGSLDDYRTEDNIVNDDSVPAIAE